MTYEKAPVAGIRPEADLLLCCARTWMDSEKAACIRALLQHDLDWAYLLRTAHQHGMAPLLYWHLNATCLEAVPKDTLDQLRDHFDNNGRRNLFLTGELLKLLNLFEAYEIPVIPYKGPLLAASVYGNLALRQFLDLDLLVHKQHVSKARELLVSQGYRPQFHLNGDQESAFLQSYSELCFAREDGRVIVDLHWAITSRGFSFPLDPERLWGHLEPISLGGKEVLTLCPEDLLLILCVHGGKHLWERLDWICGIAELIRVHKGMDWRRVMEQAGALRSERMLFLGLYLASDLLEAALPEEASQRVHADPVLRLLAVQMRERLFREANGPPGVLESWLFHLRLRDRLRDGCRYCLSLVMTPTGLELTLLPLPTSLFPLYYVLRPMRLLVKYGGKMLKHLLF
ncbi:MAG: nucleotidyltransferase family protein [Candidatus Binatia bacterium]